MFDDYVSYWARQKPQACAIRSATAEITCARFDRDVDCFTAALRQLDPPAGGLVGIRVASPYPHLLLLLALSRLGIASASLPADAASFATAASVLRPDLLLCDQPVDHAGRVAPISPDWVGRALRGTAGGPRPARPAPGSIGRVALSSGTTGRPKRIAFTWGGIVDRARRRALLDLDGSDSLLTLAGNETNFGFGQRVAGWLAGATTVLGPRGEQLPQALAALRPTVMVLSPGSLRTLLDALPPDAMPVPGLRVQVSGGTLPARLAQDARRRLSPDLHVLYASSEGGAVAYGPASLLDADPAAVGYELPWAQIEAVGPDGARCPPGVQGELRVRSDDMVSGYHDDASQTRAAFRDGWFHPGDVGRIMPDGLVRIEGRTDDLMNLGGWKLLPSAIEDAVSACPGVTDAAAFSLPAADGPETPWAAIVRGDGFDEAALAQALRRVLPKLPRLQVVWLDRIPRNAAGKVDRRLLRQRAAAMLADRAPAPDPVSA